MNNATWFLLVGGILLAMGLTAPVIRRLPVTSAIIYLTLGILVGPMVLGLFHFNPLKEAALLEVLTESAVLISLFSAGVKMPSPVTFARWRSPVLLATVGMAITVGLVALFGVEVLGLPLGAAILLGAIVAPTDPVLATDVQIRHPEDKDRLRFTLTCEAGMNDGSAFPFVMLGLGLLGLHDLGGSLGVRWLLVDLLWATAGGIAIGVFAGAGLAKLIAWLRRTYQIKGLLEDFLGLGLIATVYGFSLLVDAWGFLAVFFAAVGLRQTEQKLAERMTDSTASSVPASTASADKSDQQSVSVTALIFKEHLERLSELVLVILIGGTLFMDSWSWRAVGFAMFLFVVARPVSVFFALLGSRTSWRIRGLTGWFGVRGIGSLYYLMYALVHGLPEELGLELIHLTLIVVTLSIFVHGISVKPMMRRFWVRERKP